MADEKDGPLDAFEHGPVEHFPPGSVVRVKPWIIPTDIPEQPSKEVVFNASGGRQWKTSDPDVVAAFEALAVRVATPRLAPAEPDYDALGYPETAFGFVDPDSVALLVSATTRWLSCLTSTGVDKENG